MELQIPSFPALFPLLLFLTFIVSLIIKNSSTKKLPPGPLKLPIIGNLHNMLGCLPHQNFHKLAKKFGPIMRLQIGEVNTIIVSSPEIAKEIMKTHDIIFASRPISLGARILSYNSSDITFSPYGEYWRHMRKTCMLEVLSSKRVQSFRPIREEEVLNVMRSISSSEGSNVNLSEILFSYTYKVISRAAFGKIKKEQEAFVPYVKDINEVGGSFCIADLFPSLTLLHNIDGMKSKMEMLQRECDKIFESIIEDHKLKHKMQSKIISDDQEGDDLVDVLLRLHEQKDLAFNLTMDNVKAVILDIFLAGSDTSSTVTEWALSEMMKKPQVMKKAREEVRQVFDKKGYVDEADIGELNYLKLVIKETLRLHPPIPLLVPRESREDCEINGYRIPIKSTVFVNVWAIGRDSKYWNEAENFIPERFSDGKIDYKGTNFEFMPFGAGRRMCAGMTFGMANIEILLANLLYYFDWTLPNEMKPDDLDMQEGPGLIVERENALNLVPIVFNPLPVSA